MQRVVVQKNWNVNRDGDASVRRLATCASVEAWRWEKAHLCMAGASSGIELCRAALAMIQAALDGCNGGTHRVQTRIQGLH